jgi:hypothetical protein
LHGIGPETDAQAGEKNQFVFVVTQPETGAHGTWKRLVPANASGNSALIDVTVHADANSPPFQPGKVLATADATRLNNKREVVRTWSWTQGVELVAP